MRILTCTLTLALAAMGLLGVSSHAAIGMPEGYESFDLAQLRDGETRTFGRGDHLITVKRTGNVATIQRSSSTDKRSAVQCEIDRDHCAIGIPAEIDGRPLVVLSKERTCVNGEGDCLDVAALVGEAGGAAGAYEVTVVGDEGCNPKDADCKQVHVVRLGEGDGSGAFVIHADGDDPAGSVHVRKIVRTSTADGAADGAVQVITTGGDGETAVWIGDDGGAHALGASAYAFATGPDAALKTLLRCPEGDVTMQVAKDEADQTFLCPKHRVALDKVQKTGLVIKTEARKPSPARAD